MCYNTADADTENGEPATNETIDASSHLIVGRYSKGEMACKASRQERPWHHLKGQRLLTAPAEYNLMTALNLGIQESGNPEIWKNT